MNARERTERDFQDAFLARGYGDSVLVAKIAAHGDNNIGEDASSVAIVGCLASNWREPLVEALTWVTNKDTENKIQHTIERIDDFRKWTLVAALHRRQAGNASREQTRTPQAQKTPERLR